MRNLALDRSSPGRAAALLALVSCAVTASQVARADEPVKTSEPRILSEPGEVTDVVDAFDGDDVFDLHLTLGYQYTSKHSNIRRESFINTASNPGLSSGGFINSNMNVAAYSESTSRLNTRADIGLYHDIALYLRMPIILSDSRSLDDLNGSAGQQGVVLQGAPGEGPLFSLPFKSPQRSGIDYLAIGADLDIMNQARDRTKPTWMFGFEGRFSLGEPMHACNANPAPGQVQCPYPSDVNQDGAAGNYATPDNDNVEGQFSGGRSPGVSRGTNALEGHTFISKRIKYIEPYGGFRALFEFQQDRSDFGATDLQGSLVNHPPLQGWMIMGIQVIPWEQREQFQRVTFDARFTGAYRSEGRDYSELFDALGTSSVAYAALAQLRGLHRRSGLPSPDGKPCSVVDQGSQKVYYDRHHRRAGVRHLPSVGERDVAGGRVHQVPARRRLHPRASPHHHARSALQPRLLGRPDEERPLPQHALVHDEQRHHQQHHHHRDPESELSRAHQRGRPAFSRRGHQHLGRVGQWRRDVLMARAALPRGRSRAASFAGAAAVALAFTLPALAKRARSQKSATTMPRTRRRPRCRSCRPCPSRPTARA